MSITAALRQQDQVVQAPANVHGVEGRYASALYSAASKQGKLDQIGADMQTLDKALSSGTITSALKNPLLSAKEKSTIIDLIVEHLKLDATSGRFLQLLAENGQLGKMQRVFREFGTIMSAHRGEVICEVTSARPLDAAMLKDVEATLARFLKPKEKLVLHTKVDESILGGMIVSVGDRYADMSTRSKINLYERLVKDTI